MCNLVGAAETIALKNVDYKLLEYYDCDDEIVLCCIKYVKTYFPDPARFHSSEIRDWYSYNFCLSITAEDDFDSEDEKS